MFGFHSTLVLISILVAPPDSTEQLSVSIDLARKEIVGNDCQLVHVTVNNRADDAVETDTHLILYGVGTALELRFEGNDYEPVSAEWQGSTSIEEGGTVIPAKSTFAEFFVLEFDRWRRGAPPLFDFEGTYTMRASVSVNNKKFYSEPKSFKVKSDIRIDWEDTVSRTTWVDILRYPVPASVGKRPDVLKTLPKGALLREYGELGLEAFQYVNDPKERRDHWLNTRKEATPLAADYVSLRAATNLHGSQKYALALEEISRMKLDSWEARSLRASCEQQLKRNK